jgi:hypothetical protein
MNVKVRAALENYLLESLKTIFGSTYTTQIGQVGRAKMDFSQYPHLLNLSNTMFIEIN